MEDKIIEVKTAILERILVNISDTTKSLNAETIVSFAGIVETFDKTEEMKKQPKSDPDAYYKALMEVVTKTEKKTEMSQLNDAQESL